MIYEINFYALDSNTVSYLLRNEGEVRNNFARTMEYYGNHYAIPYVVAHEVKSWLLYKPSKATKEYNQEFDELFLCVKHRAEMPAAVWEKATEIHIKLRSRGQLIGSADILIAAYCLVNGYVLVTRNTKDFERIDGLKIVDWF